MGNYTINDVYGNIYITGQYQRSVDFNPNASVYNLTSAGTGDVYALKLSRTPVYISENDLIKGVFGLFGFLRWYYHTERVS